MKPETCAICQEPAYVCSECDVCAKCCTCCPVCEFRPDECECDDSEVKP